MRKRGLGVGSMFYGIGYGFNRPDIGAAHVEVAEDGTATLFTGVCDLGQGIQTLLAQIVGTETRHAHQRHPRHRRGYRQHARLGADIRQSRHVRAGTGGPKRQPRRQGASGGNGRPDAGHRTRRSGGRRGSGSLRLSPERNVTVLAVVDEMHKQGKRCVGWGWQDITTKDVDPTTSQGDAYQTFGWATQLAEVEVDTDTGFVQVTRLISATDAGRAINPMGVEGQVQGGAVMGLGYALYEQHVIDEGRAQDGFARVLPGADAARCP